jgi:hypothetical protein
VRALPLIIIFLHITLCQGRSPHRPVDETLPNLTIAWDDAAEKSYVLRDSHIRERMFHQYDEPFLMKHALPKDPITFRYNPKQSVEGAHLSELINDLLEEIKDINPRQKLAEFKHFEILKIRDVDFKDMTGLYVLKFKEYPFILKLFIETPEGFAQPTEKGFEPTCFFYMGGGMGRHLAGFTRIKNLDEVKTLVQNSPTWCNRIDFPRKWFWIPEQPTWIRTLGKNIGPNGTAEMKIPGTYAIICDEIIWQKPFKLTNQDNKQTIIAFSNFLDQRLDLHINNFGIEKESDKITPIDFEYFPAVVGLAKGERQCSGYLEWYTKLSLKYLCDLMFKNKAKRRAEQYARYVP